MTDLLKEVFEEISALPDQEQNRLALLVREEMLDELRWDSAFANSKDKLAKLAEQAKAAYEAGETEPLDLDAI